MTKLAPGGTGGWEKYDKHTNNGFPPNTCGGCGADDHYRNDCLLNPNRGKYPPREKGKGKGKGKNGKGKNGKGQWAKGVDDDEWAEGEEGEDDGQQADEGGSVWEEDADCVWALSDDDDDDDRVYVIMLSQMKMRARSRRRKKRSQKRLYIPKVHLSTANSYLRQMEQMLLCIALC